MSFTDLSGKKFGKLTVIKRTENTFSKGRSYVNYLCVCDCGKEKIVKAENLRSGNTKSCGCFSDYTRSVTHKTHGKTNTRIYRIYRNMLCRCLNKNREAYKNYGGRGITVCDDWLGKDGFYNFSKWAYHNGYSDCLTLDRTDNNLDYSPDNCKWSTRKEQSNNRRSNKVYQYKGEVLNIRQLSDKYKIPYETLRARLVKYGFTVEEAINVARSSKKRRSKI